MCLLKKANLQPSLVISLALKSQNGNERNPKCNNHNLSVTVVDSLVILQFWLNSKLDLVGLDNKVYFPIFPMLNGMVGF